MIVVLTGLVIGFIAGYIARVDFTYWNGTLFLMAFLSLTDEMVVAGFDPRRRPVIGLVCKAALCVFSVVAERAAGAPMSMYAVVILFFMLFLRIAWPAGGGRAAGWEIG